MNAEIAPGATDQLSRLVRREPLAGSYALLTFEHAAICRAYAGQFAMIQPEAGSELLLRRPFSIMDADPDGGRFTIFLKAIGPGSRSIFDLREGDCARVLGPLGRGFTTPAKDESIYLVGGGYGVAPFALFAHRLRAMGAAFRLFYGGRSATELPLTRELEAREIPLSLATDDGTRGEAGRVVVPLAKALDAEKGKARLYACGPHPMMRAVAAMADERGLHCEVSLDPWMGCGVGTCLGCVVRIQRPTDSNSKNRPACTEGPVFDSRHVVWDHD